MAEDRKDVPFTAAWAENLRHRPDPNRVTDRRQTPRRDEDLAWRGTTALGRQECLPHQSAASVPAERSYYNISPLKEPVWKWEIATYFFLGGMSAGAYLLGRAAERAGGRRYEDLTRFAAYVALGAIAPSPPLLIADLGDPKRFHHMLRVWKPSSPMNFGSWAITAYSGMAATEAIRQYLSQRERYVRPSQRSTLLKLMNNSVLLALHDAAGVPFSLIVAGYTGVLLSCTSNPLWCKNPFLGPLFSASAISTGAEAISLAIDCATPPGARESPSHSVLRKVASAAHVAELGMMAGFLKFAGAKAKALHSGKMSAHHKFSLGGILAAEVLKLLPLPRGVRRPVRMLINALGLAAGFSMRWSMIFGGHEAAADPHTARLVSRADDRAKQVGGTMGAAGGRVAHAIATTG